MSKRHALIYWMGFSVILALLIVAPLVLPEFWRRFVTEILIWGLLAMSSDVLIGYTGMVSFGHSAFFGLGMYGAAAALLSVRPPNLWLAILYGLIGSGAPPVKDRGGSPNVSWRQRLSIGRINCQTNCSIPV